MHQQWVNSGSAMVVMATVTMVAMVRPILESGCCFFTMDAIMETYVYCMSTITKHKKYM